LFIVGGAFVGLDDIVKRRHNKRRVGFNCGRFVDDKKELNEMLQMVTHDDLVEFGIIPELIGRLPIIAPLEELSVDDLVRVLKEPKNALLRQERKKLAYKGVELQFTDDAAKKVAELAVERGTGARALRSVVADFMTDIFFELPANAEGKKYVIDPDVVTKKKKIFTSKNEAA
jgi:ATP-dependent Clp protease ATP-binding subunit ClpX